MSHLLMLDKVILTWRKRKAHTLDMVINTILRKYLHQIQVLGGI